MLRTTHGGGGLATVAPRFHPPDGYVPQGWSAFEEVGTWSDVLPSERMTAVWFVPAIVVLAGCGMTLTANIILKLLRR